MSLQLDIWCHSTLSTLNFNVVVSGGRRFLAGPNSLMMVSRSRVGKIGLRILIVCFFDEVVGCLDSLAINLG